LTAWLTAQTTDVGLVPKIRLAAEPKATWPILTGDSGKSASNRKPLKRQGVGETGLTDFGEWSRVPANGGKTD